ncbi:MAG TPA: hypothetical protein VJV79_17040 [Polyangiaceae bacterium]|nr:hypothetical protein [Polyangiaceae bacterium]
MARWSERLPRACVLAFAVGFPWLLGCGGKQASDGSGAGSAGKAGSSPSRGGSSAGGGAGGLALAEGGYAGQVTLGGAGGHADRPGGTGGQMSGAGGRMSGAGGMAGEGGAPGAICRRYATEYTVVSFGSSQTVSCAFERASLTQICTTERGDITTTVWATLDAAVRENQPLGAHRADRMEQLIAFPSGACRLTQDYQYDSSGQLTATVVTIDPKAPCGSNEAVYDAWDPLGRQTHGVEKGVGGELCAGGELWLTYNDTLRTITTTRSGGTDCSAGMTTVSHDADGLRTTAGNGTSITSTYQTLATGEICE